MKIINVGDEVRYLKRESIDVRFHQFSSLGYSPGENIYSPTFKFHDLEWKLRLYPGGEESQHSLQSGISMLAIYLHVDKASWAKSRRSHCNATFTISIPKLGTKAGPGIHTFRSSDRAGHTGRGWSAFARRTTVLNEGCTNDSLSVVVTLESYDECPGSWSPPVCFNRDGLRLFYNQVNADVTFVVGGAATVKDRTNNREVLMRSAIVDRQGPIYGNNRQALSNSDSDDASSSSSSKSGSDQSYGQEEFKVNSTMLLMAAPSIGDILMERCRAAPNMWQCSSNSGRFANDDDCNTMTIPLPNVNPKHFRSMLRFIYSGDTSFLASPAAEHPSIGGNRATGANSMNVDTHVARSRLAQQRYKDFQDLLVVANEFGCWKLKLLLEARLIDEFLCYAASIDLLLFADSYSCAMLKEAATHTIYRESASILQHPDFGILCECSALIKELQEYCTGQGKTHNDGIFDDYSKMSVGDLYKILDERDDIYLDCDLSRLTLLRKVRSIVYNGATPKMGSS